MSTTSYIPVPDAGGGQQPLLSTVVLNWNREDLLRTTVQSYLSTISVPYELVIVDNASTDGSRDFIASVCGGHANRRAVFLPYNSGGDGLNIGLAECRGRFLHVSENDLEYLPGWDRELLGKFDAFPELGQISPFSPFHQVEQGEVWTDKAGVLETRGAASLYWALGNVGSSCVFRRELWDGNVRWGSHGNSTFQCPDDCAFSNDVKASGYRVAWNDKYLVINWGHNVAEMARRFNYYLNNANGKQYLGAARLRRALEDHGFVMVEKEPGIHVVEQRCPAGQSRAALGTALWKEWMVDLAIAVRELEAVIPPGGTYLLIDQEQFGPGLLPGRRALPFIEADGRYWGAPEDDAMALRELARMRSLGANYVVILWPCFWWLESYPRFAGQLRSGAVPILNTRQVMAFDLRPVAASAETAAGVEVR